MPPLRSCKVTKPPQGGQIGNFAVVFPEKYEGTVWRTGRDKRPETVLKELLPYLEKNAYQDRRQRTIMGFPWERPARSIGSQAPPYLLDGSGSGRGRGYQLH